MTPTAAVSEFSCNNRLNRSACISSLLPRMCIVRSPVYGHGAVPMHKSIRDFACLKNSRSFVSSDFENSVSRSVMYTRGKMRKSSHIRFVFSLPRERLVKQSVTSELVVAG
jgi:hypothetical protein